MGKNLVLGLIGIDLFFLVISTVYFVMIYTTDDMLMPFIPLIVFSGFFIFLIGAILVALSLRKVIEKRINF